MINRAQELATLQREILASNCCPRLVRYCRKVAREKRAMYRDQEYWGKAVPSFGDPQAELLILGLAPAAHGGNRTGRMFTGDRSGDFLFRALYEAGFANQPNSVHRDDGLKLKNCYITAAVRWAPPKNKPTPQELRACLPFLEEELELLTHLRAVLVLGRIAFDAFLRVAAKRVDLPPRSALRFAHGASFTLPGSLPRLYCSYHPSQQNTQTRRLTPEMFQKVLNDIRQHLAEPQVNALPTLLRFE
jgi:uracil-DNA glycosylase family 4